MIEQKISSNTIRKYLGALTPEECDKLFTYTLQKTNNPVEDPNKVPWELGKKNNTIYYQSVDDDEIKDILKRYKYSLADELTKAEGFPIYPHLTTLVLWKPGQQMPRHVDDGNGYADREAGLKMRYVTSVTYLNDNYQGGYTFVKNDDSNDHTWRNNSMLSFPNSQFRDYISKPEKGATIAFYGDDRNAHGVTKLESGDRVILSTWFTKDEQYKEPDDQFLDMEALNNMQEQALQQAMAQQQMAMAQMQQQAATGAQQAGAQQGGLNFGNLEQMQQQWQQEWNKNNNK